MRALISVYDKTGLDEFARGLAELGWELVASGGTAAFLEEHGLAVTRVESVTGFAEMLGGRVEDAPPGRARGILARRDVPEDLADLAEHGIEPFDLVVVNLYPFAEVAGRHGVTRGGGGRDDRRRRAGDAARGREELRARRARLRGRSSTSACSPSCASTASSRSRRAARSRPRRSSTPPRTSRRSPPGSPTGRPSPRA